MYKGQNKPNLNWIAHCIQIYSDICLPTRVGENEKSLLRMIWFNDKPNETFFHPIKKPIYLPITKSTINSIEIIIKDQFDLPFPFNEDTIITLHFKKK